MWTDRGSTEAIVILDDRRRSASEDMGAQFQDVAHRLVQKGRHAVLAGLEPAKDFFRLLVARRRNWQDDGGVGFVHFLNLDGPHRRT